VPAEAVKRKAQVFSKIIGCKGCVGGVISQKIESSDIRRDLKVILKLLI